MAFSLELYDRMYPIFDGINFQFDQFISEAKKQAMVDYKRKLNEITEKVLVGYDGVVHTRIRKFYEKKVGIFSNMITKVEKEIEVRYDHSSRSLKTDDGDDYTTMLWSGGIGHVFIEGHKFGLVFEDGRVLVSGVIDGGTMANGLKTGSSFEYEPRSKSLLKPEYFADLEIFKYDVQEIDAEFQRKWTPIVGNIDLFDSMYESKSVMILDQDVKPSTFIFQYRDQVNTIRENIKNILKANFGVVYGI